MEALKKHLRRLGNWQYLWLGLLVVVLLILHILVIMQPNEPMFDELHYVPDARSIIAGNGSQRTEHPPLAKLFIVLGITIFGDNPVGWRGFSVLFGLVAIVVFYLICQRLRMTETASFLATFVFAMENLSFVHAGIAMLDIYSVTFMLVMFWLYLRGNYVLCSVAGVLAALAKLTGVLGFVVIGLHWLIVRRDRWRDFTVAMLVAPLAFGGLLPVFNFAVFRHFVDPVNSIRTMLSLMSSLTFATNTHPSLSRPWEWVLKPLIMPYWYTPHYLGAISFTLWALIIPAMLYALWRGIDWKALIGRRGIAGSDPYIFAFLWFAGTYLVWIPISLVTNRISFIFYFYPVIGAICIVVGMGLTGLVNLGQKLTGWKGRVVPWLPVFYLVLHLAVFLVLSPLTNWWPWP